MYSTKYFQMYHFSVLTCTIAIYNLITNDLAYGYEWLSLIQCFFVCNILEHSRELKPREQVKNPLSVN